MRAVLVLISLLAWSLSAQAVEVMVHSSEALMGRDPQERLEFSAVVRDDEVVLVHILRPETHYLARINYARETLAIKSLAPATGAAVPMPSADIDAFTRVLRSIVLDRSSVAEALISTLTWLADHPPNMVVDFQTGRPTTPPFAPQAYTSLCASIGQTVTAQYTIDGAVQAELAVLGACAANECLGRCGTGCAANPANPAATNRYTQECLNHDACNRATNPWDPLGLFAPCRDEFQAAAQGYFFAPDCPDC
jgi:hypothetical protein